jgi:type II secretory pathway pseudopilin PulG
MSAATHEFLPEEAMAFLDGELSPERADTFSKHLETCAECSTVVTAQRELSQQMATWQVGPLPARLTERVAAATQADSAKGEPASRSVPTRRRSPTLKLIVEIAAGLAAVVLLLAIATPNLLRSRMAANESSAVGSLRTLNTAAVAYFSTYRHYPVSLRNFGGPPGAEPTEEAAGLIDNALAGGRKSGYLFTYRSTPPFGSNSAGSYAINADPLEPGKGGQRHFSTDQTGTIFADGVDLSGSGQSEKSNEHGRSREQATVGQLADTGPMIARTAELKLTVEKLDAAREGMDRILAQHRGYIAQLSASAESGSARTLIASLRVPADQLDVCIAELKKLGRVTQESQAGEEVTQQHMDLVARLKNARTTETRLNDVIQQSTGKVKDILDVEKESARVRGEIEQMEAEQKTLEHRVDFATIDLKLAEEYKAQLSSPAPSVGMQVRNATVNGFRNAFESLLGIVLFFAESGPTLVLWLAILFIPAWLIWRRYRRAHALSSLAGA